VCIQPEQMAENDDDGIQQQEMTTMSLMRNKKRHLSHIPIPSTGFLLEQLSGGYVTVNDVRKRRFASEQVNLHDR
jgi:hypothetical protein